MPSLSSYHALRRAAEAVDAWAIEHDAARTALRERDPRAFIDALLSDGDAQLAWDTAQAAAEEQLGSDLWLRLAESRETGQPGRRSHGLPAGGRPGPGESRPPCLRRRRMNPQARSKRRDGRRRPPGVQPTHRHTPRTTSPAPDPNHDARQRRPALSPSRRPRGTKLPGQSSLAAPKHFESAPGSNRPPIASAPRKLIKQSRTRSCVSSCGEAAAGRAAGRWSAAAGCAERTTRRSRCGHDHAVDAAATTVAFQSSGIAGSRDRWGAIALVWLQRSRS